MKRLMMALALKGCAMMSATAQTHTPASCGVQQNKVCKVTNANGAYCYSTPYAQNYQVCKDREGYYICCLPKTDATRTKPVYLPEPATAWDDAGRDYSNEYAPLPPQPLVPQSQSYPAATTVPAGGNPTENRKGYLKLCYGGNNAAELNRAPYQGCNSPQYDGPAANRQRNVNVSNDQPVARLH